MLFVKVDDLKAGMRLARPIYEKNGVLLYERNSKLTAQGVISVKNFGLIGIYILEPAEPVPPMTEDDIAFERFQAMCVFSLREELTTMLEMKKAPKMFSIANQVIRNYGRLDRKLNFVQNLRSKEDYLYKHSLNVAVLSALISNTLHLSKSEQFDTVVASIVHDIGKAKRPEIAMDRDSLTMEEKRQIREKEIAGYDVFDQMFATNPGIKRICVQTQKWLENFEDEEANNFVKLVMGAKILVVAETFDILTAMKYGKEPASEVAAVRYLQENSDVFDPEVVNALIHSIHILSPGICIEMNTGRKGLVLVENEQDFLKPLVLLFDDNRVIDLGSQSSAQGMEIKDVMKTLDNRYVMDRELLQKSGYLVEEPKYVQSGKESILQKESVDTDDLEEEYVPGMDL